MDDEMRIILETDAQYGYVIAWMSYNKEQFIKAAEGQENLNYQMWTYEDLIFMFDEEDEIPEKALAIVKEHGKAIEVNYTSTCKWYAPSDAPSEYEAAEEALFHDLQSSHILTKEEALHKWKNSEGSIEELRALHNILYKYGLIEYDEEDD